MNLEKEPDNLEKSIRFGCGSIFGFFIGLRIALEYIGVRNPSFVLVIILIAVVCGTLALKFGDKFWHFFIK